MPQTRCVAAIGRAFADLPGTVTVHIKPADVRTPQVVLVEHDLGRPGRYAGWVKLPPMMIADDPLTAAEMVVASVDRQLRPWRYPDSTAWFPPLDLFPRLTRLLRRSTTRVVAVL